MYSCSRKWKYVNQGWELCYLSKHFMNPLFMCGRPLGPVWKLEDQKRKINSTLGKNIEPYLWKTSSLVNILPLGNCWSVIEILSYYLGESLFALGKCVCSVRNITHESLKVSKYKEGTYSGLNKSVIQKHTGKKYHVLHVTLGYEEARIFWYTILENRVVFT